MALALAIVGYWYYTSPPDDTVNVSYESSDVAAGDVLRKVNTRTPGFDVAYELPESGTQRGTVSPEAQRKTTRCPVS